MADYYLETMNAAGQATPFDVSSTASIIVNALLLTLLALSFCYPSEDPAKIKALEERLEALEEKAAPFELEVNTHAPRSRKPTASIVLRSSHRYLVQDQ